MFAFWELHRQKKRVGIETLFDSRYRKAAKEHFQGSAGSRSICKKRQLIEQAACQRRRYWKQTVTMHSVKFSIMHQACNMLPVGGLSSSLARGQGRSAT